MIVIRSLRKIIPLLRKYKVRNKSIGFVPTMGALHKGHLSLIREARKENDIVVVSIFVNPVQFGPKWLWLSEAKPRPSGLEDFRRYPRPIKKDLSFCLKEGVDFVFLPKVKEMYPEGFKTYVMVEELSDVLCGKSRPGHFRGVATVVTKLLNIVGPDNAYFGQKDAQQAIIIKRMVKDLNIPARIKVMPTVRGKDGLALSSRNTYLSEKERKDALVLSRSLKLARDLIKRREKRAKKVILSMRQLIQRKKKAKIDYIDIVDISTLKPVKKISKNCLIALAVQIGKTRLIDNIII